jgi:hypothetical protein
VRDAAAGFRTKALVRLKEIRRVITCTKSFRWAVVVILFCFTILICEMDRSEHCEKKILFDDDPLMAVTSAKYMGTS